MPVKFEDITSYAQTDTDRTPKAWEAKIAGVRLVVVTQHRDYAPDAWVANSYPAIVSMKLLRAKTAEEAKKEAVALLAGYCRAVVTACEQS